jgi:hypothetical protein
MVQLKLRHDDRKFFPAVSAADIDARTATLLLQDHSKFFEHLIPRLMTIIIIKLLEMVDIKHNERYGLFGPIAPADFETELFLEHAVIVKASEPVMLRQMLCFVKETRFLDPRGNLVRENGHEVHIIDAETVLHGIVQADHPDCFVVNFERDTDV